MSCLSSSKLDRILNCSIILKIAFPNILARSILYRNELERDMTSSIPVSMTISLFNSGIESAHCTYVKVNFGIG